MSNSISLDSKPVIDFECLANAKALDLGSKFEVVLSMKNSHYEALLVVPHDGHSIVAAGAEKVDASEALSSLLAMTARLIGVQVAGSEDHLKMYNKTTFADGAVDASLFDELL